MIRNNFIRTWVTSAYLLVMVGCERQQHPSNLPRTVNPSDLRIIVPMNFLSGEPWRLGLGPADGTPTSFEMPVKLEPGNYSILDLFQQAERQTGRRFIWHRKPKPSSDDKDTLHGKFYSVGARPGRYALVHWKIGDQPLSTILNEALAHMTEEGVRQESPHFEVWVALVTTRTVHLLMLPSPDVDDPLAPPTSRGVVIGP